MAALLTLRIQSGICLRDVLSGQVGGIDTWTIAVIAGAFLDIDERHHAGIAVDQKDCCRGRKEMA